MPEGPQGRSGAEAIVQHAQQRVIALKSVAGSLRHGVHQLPLTTIIAIILIESP